MTRYVEWFIMIITALLIVIWLFRAFYRWLHAPVTMNHVRLGRGGNVDPASPVVQLLEKQGYEVTSGKHIIKIPIELDDQLLEHQTRLHIDYIAEMDHCTYIVKLDKQTKPIKYTAPALRDQLLMYALVLPSCAGVIIVNEQERQLRKVSFLLSD